MQKSEYSNYIQLTGVKLIEILFKCLMKQSEELDDDDGKIAKSASGCLVLISRCIEEKALENAVPYILKTISSANWREREAAIMLLGSILDALHDLKPEHIQFLSGVLNYFLLIFIFISSSFLNL